MVTIKRDQTILIVTRGAYENYFQGMGYEVVDVPQAHENSGGINYPPESENSYLEDLGGGEQNSEETSEEESDDEDLSEIPLGEMNFAQLHARAGQLGIDHENIHSKKELRAAIKAAQ